MPLDPQGALYDQVWALLEGYAPFASGVNATNRFKVTRPREDERRGGKTGIADYPALWLPTPTLSYGRGMPMTLNDSPLLVDYGIPMALTADAELVFDTTASGTQTPVEAAFDAGLMRFGRTMGLPWLNTFTLTNVSRRVEMFGGTNRLVVRKRLDASARPMRSLLITP